MVEFHEMAEVACDKIGCSCRFVKTRTTSEDLACIAKDAALILIAGGDPLVGWEAMTQNGVCAALKEAHERGAVLVAISAGAMILGSWCFELSGGGGKSVSMQEERERRRGRRLAWYLFAIAPHREATQWSEPRQVLREVLDESLLAKEEKEEAREGARAPSMAGPVAMLGLPFQGGVCVGWQPLTASRRTGDGPAPSSDGTSSDSLLEHFPPTRYRLHRHPTQELCPRRAAMAARDERRPSTPGPGAARETGEGHDRSCQRCRCNTIWRCHQRPSLAQTSTRTGC